MYLEMSPRFIQQINYYEKEQSLRITFLTNLYMQRTEINYFSILYTSMYILFMTTGEIKHDTSYKIE